MLFRWVAPCLMLMAASMIAQEVCHAQSDSAYRVLIIDGQSIGDAEALKESLQTFGYSPILLDQQNNQYRVLYGNFQTQAQAEAARARLGEEGIRNQGVVQTAARPALSSIEVESSYQVFVREYLNRIDANREKEKLEGMGYAGVSVQKAGLYFQVVIGNFNLDEATVVLGRLRNAGYATTAEVREAAPQQVDSPTRSSTGTGVISGSGVTEMSISSAITQSDVWQDLSEDQKRRVINTVVMQKELRQGDSVASKVIEIDKRLETLDNRLKGLITEIDNEQRRTEETIGKINEHIRQAEFEIRSGNYNAAKLELEKVARLDADNKYGQKSYVDRRIAFANSKLEGEQFEGQNEYNQQKASSLEEDARRLASKSPASESDLQHAIALWTDYGNLDKTQFQPKADSEIGQLKERLNRMREESNTTQTEMLGEWLKPFLIAGAVVAALLVLLLVLLFSRMSKQKKQTLELQRKLSEITSMRPMRELSGGGGGQVMLETGSGSTHSGTDIFTPQTTSMDPLGGMEDDDVATENKEDEDDSLFGSMNSGASSTSGEDMGLDDLFGADDSSSGSGGAPAKAAPSGDDEDDVFAGLFGDDDSSKTKDAPVAQKPAPKKPAPKKDDVPAKPESVGPISFDDFGGGDDSPETESTNFDDTGRDSTEDDDLLAMFDEAIGSDTDATVSPGASDSKGGLSSEPVSFGDENPFADLSFGEEEPDTSTKNALPTENSLDDSEFPSLNLDLNDTDGAETALNMGSGSSPEADSTNANGEVPSFAFDEVTARVGGGTELNYEDAASGTKPGGWSGDYDYATLLVESESPPQGSSQYLAFRKGEGKGKALFSYSFPEIGGKVQIEFDLRCNDKNKFLLGFYIEKDGDFQQAIHTKILRSEAQTTPTIHMQGESAPYLLGSWAHIKYVVDLEAGKLDGWIDNTQVARDLPLQPNPGTLNTMSIRDNINTTGVLLLNNVKIKPLS